MFKTSEELNVYYNIKITGDSNINNVASFSENRVQPILNDPSKYQLAVARFSVPARKLPIMFFRNGEAAYGYAPEEKYTITMSYDGVDFTRDLQYIQTDLPTETYGLPTVWNYQDFVRMVNNAFGQVFFDLKAAKPLAPPVIPPIIYFFEDTERFALYAPIDYDVESGTPTIEIFFNNELHRLFDAFQMRCIATNPPNKKWQYLVQNHLLNLVHYGGNDYFVMKQDTSTLYLWNEIQSLEFETNNIPINPEFMPSQTNIIRRVITDFEPESSSPSRQVIQFYPQGELRYYDLKSNYPLKAIDLNVSWIDRKGITRPIYVSEEDPLTVKIQFRRII